MRPTFWIRTYIQGAKGCSWSEKASGQGRSCSEKVLRFELSISEECLQERLGFIQTPSILRYVFIHFSGQRGTVLLILLCGLHRQFHLIGVVFSLL